MWRLSPSGADEDIDDEWRSPVYVHMCLRVYVCAGWYGVVEQGFRIAGLRGN